MRQTSASSCGEPVPPGKDCLASCRHSSPLSRLEPLLRTPNNSEQLVIENALYAYRNESNFFNIKVTAGLMGASNTLAGTVIQYLVEDTSGTEIDRTMLDCSKDTAPTAFLEGEIFADVCTRLNYWLHRHHGVSELEAQAVLANVDNDPSIVIP